MSKLEIPGDRDFPPDHFEARRDHLTHEARADLEVGRRRARRFWRFVGVFGSGGNKRRVVIIGAVLIAIATGTYVAVDRETGGTTTAGAAVRVSFGSGENVINVPRAIEARMQNGDAEIDGGSAEQRDLLREILSRMPNNSLTLIKIVPKVYMGKKGVALGFLALSDDFPRSDWEKMLVAGAFRALSAERGLPAVLKLPSRQPNYSPTTETAGDVEANIRAAASDVGADVVQLQVYQPDGIAPAVILKVDDPGPFLKNRLLGFLDKALSDRWLKYEGNFVEVVDSDGAFVWEGGSNSLAMEGSVGTRPDLEGCNPIIHTLSIGPGPPPCPVS